jgi:hypothetical protein
MLDHVKFLVVKVGSQQQMLMYVGTHIFNLHHQIVEQLFLFHTPSCEDRRRVKFFSILPLPHEDYIIVLP